MYLTLNEACPAILLDTELTPMDFIFKYLIGIWYALAYCAYTLWAPLFIHPTTIITFAFPNFSLVYNLSYENSERYAVLERFHFFAFTEVNMFPYDGVACL